MTAREALDLWEAYGDAVSLPQIYREMGLTRLRILVAEESKPPQRSAIDRMPIPRLNYNPLDRALGRETPPDPAPPVAATVDRPLPQAPKTLRDKALTNPVRLRTPGRRRASFLYHLAVCGCVAEAAARAQIGRSTLYRWRDDLPRFAERWDEAIARRQRVVGDDIVLLASQIEFQPVLSAGKTVGQRRKINAQLLMHVQKRLDADRRRAEDRAERRELALLRATPVDEEALAERLLVLMERRRETSHPVSHEAAPETSDSANINKDWDEAA